MPPAGKASPMLNVAVIGTGSIADAHLRAYLDAADQVRVVALADLTVEKAETARERFGLT
ncbi:MAG: Gfo/Idh/MocA family oxidoreductase, partial [Brachybacterium tyrofermentans]